MATPTKTIRINLLRAQERPKRAPAARIGLPAISLVGVAPVQRILVAALVVVLLGVGWLYYSAWSERNDHVSAIRALRTRDAQLQKQLVELRAVEAAKREIERRLEIIGRVAKSQGLPVAMMTGVLKAVPQGLWLTSFEVKPREVRRRVEDTPRTAAYAGETISKLQEKKEEAQAGTQAQTPAQRGGRPQAREVTEIEGFNIVIKGVAFSNFQVADFMENLRKAGVFADVDFTVTQATSVERVRVMSFEVTASVKL